jgi:hypothetical protein
VKCFSISSRRSERYNVHAIEVVKSSSRKRGNINTLEALMLPMSNADPVVQSYYSTVSIQKFDFGTDFIHMRKTEGLIRLRQQQTGQFV